MAEVPEPGRIPSPAEVFGRPTGRATVPDAATPAWSEDMPLEAKMDALLGPDDRVVDSPEPGARSQFYAQQVLGTVPVSRAARLAIGLPLPTLDPHKAHEVDL